MQAKPKTELIWASPRELLNIIQADEVGCHIITATNDILNSFPCWGRTMSPIRSIRWRCSIATPRPPDTPSSALLESLPHDWA